MKRVCLVVFMLVVVAGAARADVLWYNGDPDLVSGLASAVGGLFYGVDAGTALSYDNFIVPSGGWVVDAVWSNALMSSGFSASTAYWEVRSGVSAGNGGSLIASGTNAVTQSDLGTNVAGYEVYNLLVGGLNVPLGAGTYWLTVAPVDGTFTYESYIATTSGSNAVGSPPGNDGDSFITAAIFGETFVPAINIFGGQTDFSMGVGSSSGQIPEPCTVALFGLGALGLLKRRRK